MERGCFCKFLTFFLERNKAILVLSCLWRANMGSAWYFCRGAQLTQACAKRLLSAPYARRAKKFLVGGMSPSIILGSAIVSNLMNLSFGRYLLSEVKVARILMLLNVSYMSFESKLIMSFGMQISKTLGIFICRRYQPVPSFTKVWFSRRI